VHSRRGSVHPLSARDVERGTNALRTPAIAQWSHAIGLCRVAPGVCSRAREPLIGRREGRSHPDERSTRANARWSRANGDCTPMRSATCHERSGLKSLEAELLDIERKGFVVIATTTEELRDVLGHDDARLERLGTASLLQLAVFAASAIVEALIRRRPAPNRPPWSKHRARTDGVEASGGHRVHVRC
jgi:hypothetical protein